MAEEVDDVAMSEFMHCCATSATARQSAANDGNGPTVEVDSVDNAPARGAAGRFGECRADADVRGRAAAPDGVGRLLADLGDVAGTDDGRTVATEGRTVGEDSRAPTDDLADLRARGVADGLAALPFKGLGDGLLREASLLQLLRLLVLLLLLSLAVLLLVMLLLTDDSLPLDSSQDSSSPSIKMRSTSRS